IGGRATHFVLTKNPAATAKTTERLDKLIQMAKDKQITQKQNEEGRELLSRMPRLKSQQSLRKAYQELVEGKLSVEKFERTREGIVEKTKLKRTDAIDLAKKVLEGSQILRDNYVKEVNQGELVGWAIRGLFRRLDEKIPADIQERMAKIKEMKEAELAVL